MRTVALVLVYGLAAIAAVVAFIAFDRTSHSASDTLRPFFITMIPIVVAVLLATRRLRDRA